MNMTTGKMVNRSKKVFVGGLSATTDTDDLNEYFSKFGKVQESMLLYDKQTNRHRGFAFVTFETEDAAEAVVQKHFHEIKSKIVECKVAQPKEIMMGTQPRTPRTRAPTVQSTYPYATVDPTTAYLLASGLGGISNLAAYPRAPAGTTYAAYPQAYAIPGTLGGNGISFVDPQTAIYHHPGLQLAQPPQQQQTLYAANDMAAAVASLRANMNGQLAAQQARQDQINQVAALGQIPASALANGDLKRDIFTTMLNNYNGGGQGATLAGYPSQSRALAAAAAGNQGNSTDSFLTTTDPNNIQHFVTQNPTPPQSALTTIPASLAGHLATNGALITGLTYQ